MLEIDRNKLFAYFAGFVFLLLFLRLFQLQVVENKYYLQYSQQNAAKIFPLRAPRGIIYDRYGKVVVANQPVLSLQVLPHVLADKSEEEKKRIASKLSSLIGEPVQLKTAVNESPIIKDRLSLELAAKVEEHKRELEGVAVTVRPARLYPEGKAAAHLIGYIGEIEPLELEKLKNEGYTLGDFIGKEGVEKIYDRLLRGKDGREKIEVDVYGTPLRLVESLGALPGANLKLTIDFELQLAVDKIIGNQEGAVVAMDPRNGEILALASHPEFDPNLLQASLEQRRFPFMNRALGLYPPGSIFKIITLTAALEEDKSFPQETFFCPGYYQINNRIAKCWKEGGHGRISLMEGLVWSCDIVFYELGKRLGPDLIAKYARGFGLGERSGIDLPQEKKGLIPTAGWKAEALKEPWYPGDSINLGIGQGFIQVTPLQMAAVYGTIATGKRFQPHILLETKPRETGRAPLSEKNLSLIRKALADVVERGTGVAARIEGFAAAGKTGTAQNPGRPHAWFICWAPVENPEIVIASLVVHGEHGDRASAYIARDILAWYNKHRHGPLL